MTSKLYHSVHWNWNQKPHLEFCTTFGIQHNYENRSLLNTFTAFLCTTKINFATIIAHHCPDGLLIRSVVHLQSRLIFKISRYARETEIALPGNWVKLTRMPLCTEKQARAAVYISTRNVRIQYYPQFERGLKSEPKNKGYKYTQVYTWELVISWVWRWGDWSSHSCQTLCWIQLKHVSQSFEQ